MGVFGTSANHGEEKMNFFLRLTILLNWVFFCQQKRVADSPIFPVDAEKNGRLKGGIRDGQREQNLSGGYVDFRSF